MPGKTAGHTAAHWPRWQLTAPLAALARPLRSGAAEPVQPGAGRDGAGSAAERPACAGADDAERIGVAVLLDGAPARQVDATTCGAAVLVMLAATGDPALAAWLETGAVPGRRLPPEVPRQALRLRSADARFAAAQRRVKQTATRGGRRGPPWPPALGTAPWAAASLARFPGARYRQRPMDDATPDARAVLERVASATLRGVPVPLYTGGDLRQGVAAAVPRHVVLAVPPAPGIARPGVLQLYEPGRGRVHAVPLTALLARSDPHPALGGWTHVTIALLPRLRAARVVPPTESRHTA